jgi:thiol:disulfide interchange protein
MHKRIKCLRFIFYLLVIGFTHFLAFGQDVGIKFESHLSWNEILAKAKTENKYIFIDCYTTWCGPCKYMSKNIFTQKEVGDYFN